MAITVKKKSLKIKTADETPADETALTDLPDLSDMPPVARMGGASAKKASGEYLVTGVFGIVALIIMIGVLALQLNEWQFYSNLFIK
ncbi:MAG: hypothetical protein PF692_06020 [Kiritimatiellae bacterium]|jgi:hypothetical protein|nr:hypothetical protein [Kiritimatiellia bacterium]